MKQQENTLAGTTDPIFSLHVYDDGLGDIEIMVETPKELNFKAPAPLGLLYGLAIMTLDELDQIQQAVDVIIEDRMLSTGEAVKRLACLTMGVANAKVI